MKKEIKISLLFGLSILIDYLTIFSNKKEILFKIEFNDKLIKELRNEYSQEYFNCLNSFLLENIKEMDNVILCNDPGYPYVSPEEIIKILKINKKSLISYNLLKDHQNDQSNPYLVLNTKVITGKDYGIKEKWQNEVKFELLEKIKKSKYDVYLIGEKKYSDCHEYRLHNTFNIYEDIISYKIPKIHDLTTDNTIDLYKKEIIIRNLKLLNKSKFNIHIGEGGGIKIYSSFNNLLAFTSVSIIMRQFTKSNYYIESSFDSKIFLDKAEKIILN